jgi:hypothetical protein
VVLLIALLLVVSLAVIQFLDQPMAAGPPGRPTDTAG